MPTESLLKRIRTWFYFLARWLREVAIWFTWEVRLFWLMALGALAVAVLCFVFVPCLERQIRLISLGLQLIGFGTVAWGLRDVRKLFNKPTVLQDLAGWSRRFPRFRPLTHVLSAQGIAVGSGFVAARGRQNPNQSAPLNERVDQLEKNYVSLFDEVGTLTTTVKQNKDELRSAVADETKSRTKADEDIEARLDEAVVGGLHLEFVGLLFFLVGMILSAISPEISSVLSGRASCPAIWAPESAPLRSFSPHHKTGTC